VASLERAQSLVEFGFVLPVILVLTLGLIDLGRAFVFGVSVQEGARQAARLAATANIDSSITDAIVLSRFIAAADPALNGCTAVTTGQQCNGGTWTLNVSVVNAGTTYASVAGARLANALPGAMVTVTANGSVALVPGVQTGAFGLALPQISVQGQAAMVIL
jgi:Flp pilus assembly protein TadG